VLLYGIVISNEKVTF